MDRPVILLRNLLFTLFFGIGSFVIVGLALYFRLNHVVDAWLLSVMPAWLVDLSVAI